MFEKSAFLYDVYYSFLDYATASSELHALIQQLNPNAKTLLDVACGTGKYLENLREHYQVEGLDILPDLLEIARERCPEVPFHQGDMVDFNLGHRFDVVTCLFCSIGYVKTIENAELAVACMARHLRPGGILVVEPWVSPENCWINRVSAEFTDKPNLKIVRMYTHKIEGRTSVFDINYLVGTPEGVTYFKEREQMGLFTHEEYIRAFEKAGLTVSHYDRGLFPKHNYGLYIGLNNKLESK
jgi:ubiquinone/menaquinone biosynthesis C-methylase UbiE